MVKCLLTTFILVLCFGVVNGSEIVKIDKGFMDGNDFDKMTENDKHSYVIGVIDGFLLAPIFKASHQLTDEWSMCISKMDSLQILAMVEKHHRQKPEMWHLPMHLLIYQASLNACPGYKSSSLFSD